MQQSRYLGRACLWIGIAAAATLACEQDADPSSNPQITLEDDTTDEFADVDDARVSGAVERELFFDGSVDSSRIDVETNGGIVELRGTVDNLLARDRAEQLASVVKGVRSISNQIDVAPAPRPDDEIRSDVISALQRDPAVSELDLDVTVDDRVVRLEGKAGSSVERDVALRLARGVRGARDVEDAIEVRYADERTDAQIRKDVEKRIDWDALVDGENLSVSVENGTVHLSGAVGSLAEKRRASRDAWVLGARAVDTDALDVKWWAVDPDRRTQRFVTRDPEAIQRAVADAMLVDPRVNAFDVVATATGTRVTLKGSVETLRAKRVAESIAQNTTGVSAVDNQILVAPTRAIAQAQLERNTVEALLQNPITESFEIDVTARAGVVTLRGTVDSYAEKAEAEDVASSVRGVVEVINGLVVSNPLPFVYDPYTYPNYPHRETWRDFTPPYAFKTDASIVEDIEEEMFWSPFVDANEVTVTVQAGVATLSGRVDSFREVAAATENAFEGGAIRVENRLRVAAD